MRKHNSTVELTPAKHEAVTLVLDWIHAMGGLADEPIPLTPERAASIQNLFQQYRDDLGHDGVPIDDWVAATRWAMLRSGLPIDVWPGPGPARPLLPMHNT